MVAKLLIYSQPFALQNASVGMLLAAKIHGNRTMNKAANLAHHGSLSNDFINAGPSLGKAGKATPLGDVADDDDFVDAGDDDLARVFMTEMVRRTEGVVLRTPAAKGQALLAKPSFCNHLDGEF